MLGQDHHLGQRVERTARWARELDDDGALVRRLDGDDCVEARGEDGSRLAFLARLDA